MLLFRNMMLLLLLAREIECRRRGLYSKQENILRFCCSNKDQHQESDRVLLNLSNKMIVLGT